MTRTLVAAATLVYAASQYSFCLGLDNGMFRVPPMGWLAWGRFRCITDCQAYPQECIHENLFKDMADVLSSAGWADAGYKWVNVDDCWVDMKGRDPATQRLKSDPQRFPSGMKHLGEYIHSKGLLYGIYSDIGKLTCAGYPGTLGHFDTDAQTFADWKVDSLKLDGCYVDASQMGKLYPEMGRSLNNTGRHIAYICSWPAYIIGKANFTEIAKYCNSWRNYFDVQDSWDSVNNIISWWAANQKSLIAAAGPGAWNDPDMLVIGNAGLSKTQSKIQMAIWSIVAAPLMMSHDLRRTPDWVKDILLNKEIIAVSQDPLGIEGQKAHDGPYDSEIWTRKLRDGKLAVAIVRRKNNEPAPIALHISVPLSSIGWSGAAQVRDVFNHKDLGTITRELSLAVEGYSVEMVVLSPAKGSVGVIYSDDDFGPDMFRIQDVSQLQ